MRRLTTETCPICCFQGEVRDLGPFGFAAHCSECYEGDPESASWRRIQGHGATAEDATAKWLEDARELAAVDEIPSLVVRFTPRHDMWTELQRQIEMESAAQRGLDLVDGWRWVDAPGGNRRPQNIIYAEFHSC
jgi:hypothetical protein